MKLMTYNIRYADETSANPWSIRKQWVADLIQREAPHIIGTQEGFYDQLTDLSSLLPDYQWIGLGREGGSKGEFMAIFYQYERFEVKGYDHFWLSDTPQEMGSNTWGNSCVRMATWIHFIDRETNDQFYVLNTHLDHESEQGRLKSAELISRMSESFGTIYPVFITGDFNTGAASTPYEILVNDGPYTDAWQTAGEKTNAHLGSFNDFTDATGGADRIDWLLYRGNVQVQSIKTIDTQHKGKFPSDHFPIVAEVEMTAE